MNKIMSALVVGLFVMSLLVIMGGCTTASTQETSTPALNSTELSVYGSAEIELDPDLAEIELGVETEGKTATEAAEANAAIMERVRAALLAAGVQEANIKTSSFSVAPRYKWDEDTNEQSIVGYTATHTLHIKSENVKNSGKIIDAAVSAGANRVNSVQFTLKDSTMNKVRADLLKQAVGNAASDANAIASALGHKIIGVKSVSAGASYVPYRNYAMYDKAMSAETMIIPGQVKVSASVSAVYLSEPAGGKVV
ncbi:MAG: SIMPL domain-containing protein [Candidatus Micrarchaeota archaeon]|nr:SIMPL domain-containing protein [Candidatus Micrarchaeota archaeon]